MSNTYLIFMIVFRTVFSGLSSSCSLYLPMYLFSRRFIICYFVLYTFLMAPLYLHLLPSQGPYHHIWRKQCTIYIWRRQDCRGDIDFSSVYRFHHSYATDLRICIVSDNTGDLCSILERPGWCCTIVGGYHEKMVTDRTTGTMDVLYSRSSR